MRVCDSTGHEPLRRNLFLGAFQLLPELSTLGQVLGIWRQYHLDMSGKIATNRKHRNMRTKTVKLDDLTRSVLLRSKIVDNTLQLPEQLERADYVKVAKAIEAAGGKWNKKAKMHIFPEPVKNCMDIDEETVEIVNHKQTFQAFYTPDAIANEVARLADLTAGDTVLEPSVGTGQLARAAVRHGIFWSSITGIDIDRKRINELEINGFKQLVCADFLTCRPGVNRFDRVLMNPPFSMGDDIKHVRHALQFLKPGGRLVSIVGTGPKQQHAFKNGHFPAKCDWVELRRGSFTESGTLVNTAIIMIDKSL